MLKHRISSGIIAVVVLVLSLWFLPVYIAIIGLLILSFVAQREFYAMMTAADIPVFRVIGIIVGSLMILLTFFSIQLGWSTDLAVGGESVLLFSCLIAIFLRMLWQENNPKPIETIACTLLGIFWVPFMLNFFTRLAFTWRDGGITDNLGATAVSLVAYLVVVVKSTDTGAFFVGRSFGKHKMFPRISPAKTWEGLAGGVGTAVLFSLAIFFIMKGQFGNITMRWYDSIILGVILSLAGVLGDLFESLLKRSAKVKDSGDTIPGMGGLLDMLDSLLFSIALLYGYILFFLV
ncbi:MAG: phosphatidate cytidylyltransferase [Kiritimatiellae bacterium]|nr:phosphatidate cytidylyltransferase [Kiritimatiellia bacterium]